MITIRPCGELLENHIRTSRPFDKLMVITGSKDIFINTDPSAGSSG